MNNRVFQDYLRELDDDDILTFVPLKFAYKKKYILARVSIFHHEVPRNHGIAFHINKSFVINKNLKMGHSVDFTSTNLNDLMVFG